VPSAAAVIGSRRFDGVPALRREYVVEVLVEVKGGRVADARVWKPQPGASAYEAVALKMARERRYPEGFNGGERLRIRVKP
jgi:ABC-type microcin C transport system duplicated ATPase subunit YejF